MSSQAWTLQPRKDSRSSAALKLGLGSSAWKSPTKYIGLMFLPQTALSRATPWGIRPPANGAFRRTSSASIAERMTAAATRFGFREGKLSFDEKDQIYR